MTNKKRIAAAEALKRFRLAADQGHAAAQLELGHVYARGNGVPQDYAEAVKWYRVAADKGERRAQVILGVMYKRGLGVPQDFVQAHMWFNIVAAAGGATTLRNQLAEKMTPDQIAEAQRLAREWMAARPKP